MLPGKSQGATRPTAMGSLLQASTYGQTIPTIYGMTQSPLLAIWAANLRQGGSVKKFKQYKKGITAYVENIDFLLGHNPIMGVMQMWNNGSPIPLNFTSQSFTASAGRGSFVVTDSNFYAVVGVTLTQSYSVTFNDYGGTGSQTLTGSYEVPLWNELETGPDPTDPMSYRCWPFSYRWQPAFGTTVYIDAESFPAGTLKVYYAQLKSATSGHTPLAFERLAFESELGSGTEYSDASLPGQQIIYPMFAGCGSSDIDLGSGGVIPELQAEVKGKWGVYSTGDADFADMIEDVFKSGVAQAAIGSDTANTQVEHGLSSYSYPGTIQKKTDSHATIALPPMLYDMPNTPGNLLVVACASAGTLSISSSAGDSWTPVLSSALGYQVWYATAVGGQNTVTISGTGTPWEMTIYEIGGVGELDSVSSASSGGTLGITLSKTGAATPAAGVGVTIAAIATGFQLFSALPTGAVVQGIYPVVIAGGNIYHGQVTAAHGNGMSFNMAGGFTGGVVFPTFPSGTPGPYSGEYYDSSIGNSLGLLSGAQIGVGVEDSVPVSQPGNCWAFGGMYPSGDVLNMAAQTGYAVYYTAASPVIDTTYPPPFAVPSGQGLAWALPTAGAVAAPTPLIFVANGACTGGTWVNDGGATITISDPSGHTWTASTGQAGGEFEVTAVGDASIASTVTQGQPGFLMSLPWYSSGAPTDMDVPIWDLLSAKNLYAKRPAQIQAHGQIVYSPGDYDISEPGTPTQLALLSVKSPNPPTYPRPLGDFIDLPSLDTVRAQCRAGGLWGSLTMNSQQDASDWLKTLYQAANSAPVFAGFKLYSAPYSEVSAVGNGIVYNAPTAGGPVYNLSTENGDFITSGSEPPIQVQTSARINQPNVLQMQCINRNSNYNPSVVEQPDAAGISLFGVRKADPVVNNAVQDVSIARALLGIQVRKLQYGGDVYSFSLAAKWCLLAPMGVGGGGNNDAVITITDPLANINQIPVRLTSVEEQNDGSLACTAEAFVYGMYSPTAFSADTPSPYTVNPNTPSASINAPIFFEPTPRLVNIQNQGQLWIVVSSPDATYGGSQCYISTDGGSSYNQIGSPLVGSATTGVSTADWPADTDPDTTNDLPLNLTESLGALLSYDTTSEDNFQYPCYIAGGGSYAIPYELMAYAVATLTSAYNYTLKATGGGNELRRGVYSAPAQGIGVDHPTGSRWAFINPTGEGILKLPLDPAWIGTTLYFKFVTFNTFGTATQTLAEATAYPYTVLGTSGSGPQLFQVNGA